MIDTLCFSGGGIKGFSFIGVLDYLEKNNKINLELIKNYVGTSCGAMLSFLLSINYSIDELKEFILNFNFQVLINETDNNIENLLINFGLDDGNKIIYMLQSFLKNKYNTVDITFEEHYELTNNNLIIIGTNYTKSSEVIFNYKNTPSVSVITALRISISIPLIFTPVFYNDNCYIDGALVNNFPINHCNIKNTIGINIINKHNKLDNITLFITNCIGILMQKKYESLNIINICELEDEICNAIDFNVSKEKKNDLINLGYNIAEDYISKLSYSICNSIINDIISSIFI